MNHRTRQHWTTFCLLLVFGCTAIAHGHLGRAEERERFVSLLLQTASAEKGARDVVFHCKVAVENSTGRELTVKTNFSSACDGLVLVATTPEGHVLAQQPYIYHQSPHSSSARSIVLKAGATKGDLVFPISAFPGNVGDAVKVRLIGTLPGSGYEYFLSSETLDVELSGERR